MTPPLIISSSVIVVNEVSASFFFGTASNAITASFISDFDPIITSVPSSSWASSSLSSSYSLKSLTADTASSVPIFLPTNSNQLLLMGHINSDATIYQLNSAIKADNHGALSASAFYGTSSWSSNAINANSASFVLNAVSASYVPDIDIAVTSVASASWSSASLSSSYSKNADTASFVLNAVSASFSPNQGATTLFTGSTYPITSSWSSNSVTASFITLSQTASYVTTAQTASFNLNSVSSSYSKNADTSSFANTASYSVTSSYATVGVDTTRVAKAGDGMSGSLTLSASNIVFSPTTATVGGLSWPNQNNWKVLPATSNALVWTSGGSGIITFDNSGLQLIAAGTYLGFATTTNANPDVALYREAAGVLSLRTVSGSSFTAPIPQSIRIYNFYSASGAQFERTSNYWSGSNYYIATEYSGSSALARDINFLTSGSNRLYISGSGNIGINTITPTSASLTVNGNVFATSYTGSLLGTSSFSNRIVPTILQCGSSSVSAATSINILLATAMPNTQYNIFLSANSALTSPAWSGQTITGFTASFGSFSGQLDWLVVSRTQ